MTQGLKRAIEQTRELARLLRANYERTHDDYWRRRAEHFEAELERLEGLARGA